MKVPTCIAALIALLWTNLATAAEPFTVDIYVEDLKEPSQWVVYRPSAGIGVHYVATLPASKGSTVIATEVDAGHIRITGELDYPTLLGLQKRSNSNPEGQTAFFATPGATTIKTRLSLMQKTNYAQLQPAFTLVSGSGAKINTELFDFWQGPAKTVVQLAEEISRLNDKFKTEYPELHEKQMARFTQPGQKKITFSAEEQTLLLDQRKQDRKIASQGTDALRQAVTRYIEQNPKSYLSLWYSLTHLHMFGEQLSLEYMQSYFPKLKGEITQTHEYAAMARQYEGETAIRLGEITPDFKLPAPDGEQLALSDLRGKYVLVDTWASWCTWCRKENDNMAMLYKKYAKEPFEILAVSVDEDDEAWREAMEEDNVPWLQVVDYRGAADNAINTQYATKAIPFIFLVDPEGKLVGKHLRKPDVAELGGDVNMNKVLEDIFGY